MAKVCVIYLSEDEEVVGRLVHRLRTRWDVWWARDIAHGNWERVVRTEIAQSAAVVAVLSRHADGDRADIIRDEMLLAKTKGIPLFPFLISLIDMPLGFGGQNRTDAYGFSGQEDDEGYRELERRLTRTLGAGRAATDSEKRAVSMTIRNKTLQLPAFVFSLSSHETQVAPGEGAALLHLLASETVLVSAYDAWKYYKANKAFASAITSIRASQQVLFFDSGNYESNRKNDRYQAKRNPGGWTRKAFLETARRYSPDIAFSFDTMPPAGPPDQIAARIVKEFRRDERALRDCDFPLCPIIHLPQQLESGLTDLACEIVTRVVSTLDPLMVAIPERELGNGILERARKVRDIRQALNSQGKYYPLHLLGTGNPLSMIAFAAAGADSFDGLEWCRTIADYEHGFLFHFQHFDCFRETQQYRIEDQKARRIVEDVRASYAARALSYNVDYFRSATRTLQSMIHAGQAKTLLNEIPNIGSQIYKDLPE